MTLREQFDTERRCTGTLQTRLNLFTRWLQDGRLVFRDEPPAQPADQVTRLIAAALEKSYLISVFDGEEWSTRLSTDAEAIYKAARGVDECLLRFSDPSYPPPWDAGIGSVSIIWENTGEEISDYTSNPAMDALYARATES